MTEKYDIQKKIKIHLEQKCGGAEYTALSHCIGLSHSEKKNLGKSYHKDTLFINWYKQTAVAVNVIHRENSFFNHFFIV